MESSNSKQGIEVKVQVEAIDKRIAINQAKLERSKGGKRKSQLKQNIANLINQKKELDKFD